MKACMRTRSSRSCWTARTWSSTSQRPTPPLAWAMRLSGKRAPPACCLAWSESLPFCGPHWPWACGHRHPCAQVVTLNKGRLQHHCYPVAGTLCTNSISHCLVMTGMMLTQGVFIVDAVCVCSLWSAVTYSVRRVRAGTHYCTGAMACWQARCESVERSGRIPLARLFVGSPGASSVTLKCSWQTNASPRSLCAFCVLQ